MFTRYTRSEIWFLFLICAFPIHIWALILFFQDIAWIAERSNFWDALGVGAYGLLIALAESLFVTFCVWLLSFLTPKTWTNIKQIHFMGTLVMAAAVWAICGQSYFLFEAQLPIILSSAIALAPHPLWVVYGLVFAAVGLSIGGLALAGVKSERYQAAVSALFERLTLLSGLYLVFDGFGLVIVLIRNL